MSVRGIRGATTAASNTRQHILEATAELLSAIVEVNTLELDQVASAIFTTTPDLNATFPALAARQLGWDFVPLMCAQEIEVPGSLPSCIRVLLHVNTEQSSSQVRHVYLRGAIGLRDAVAQNLA